MKKLFTVACLAVFLACGAVQGSAAPSSLPVYVSILPQKYFVERIGGSLVDVAVMVGPGKSPATYEPTPRQMETLSKARLYFSIGVPFEKAWMKRLRANHPQLRIVDTIRGIKLRPMVAHDHHHDHGEEPGQAHHNHHDHGHDHVHGKGMLDPHVWTSPPQVKIMAERIFQALKKELPGQAPQLEANYRAFMWEMDGLTKDVQDILRPVKSRSFLVFHPAWGYFAETFSLHQVAIEQAGKEPGARGLAHTIEFAKEHDIHVIFVQKQFSSQAAHMIAEAIHGRVEAVNPLAENYSTNLLKVAHVFAEAMQP